MTEDQKAFESPEWLEALAIEDSLVGTAYENTPPEQRASLKKTIACLASVYGERPLNVVNRRRFRMGVTVTEKDAPSAFALFVCPADYPYPQRLLAAVMPAVFAGVPVILPCFLVRSGEPAAQKTVLPGLLTALELAGVETAYLMDGSAFGKLLKHCDAWEGRLVELRPPDGPGGSAVTPLSAAIPSVSLARVMTSEGAEEVRQHGLFLGEGYGDIWAWPQLSAEWFRNRHFSFTARYQEG